MERSERARYANQDGAKWTIQAISTLHEESRQQNDVRRLIKASLTTQKKVDTFRTITFLSQIDRFVKMLAKVNFSGSWENVCAFWQHLQL